LERADLVIGNATNLGVESFIRPDNIATGNARLNLAFCAQIFNTNPGLTISEKELLDMAGLIDDENSEDSREERVFRMWINSLGIDDLYVHNLFEDLRDGVVLLQLHDRVVPGTVSWKQVNKPPKNRYKVMENCNYVVVIGKGGPFNFSLVNVGGIDIADRNKKLMLSIVWQLMRMHSLKLLSSVMKDGSMAKEADVIHWANQRVLNVPRLASEPQPPQITSLKDGALKDSTFFLALCSAMAPGVVDPEIVTPGETPEDRELNAKYVISVARKVGACVFLTWEDIVETKSKMLLTFVASLMAWDQLENTNHSKSPRAAAALKATAEEEDEEAVAPAEDAPAEVQEEEPAAAPDAEEAPAETAHVEEAEEAPPAATAEEPAAPADEEWKD
jgi:plastin-1